MSERVKTFWNRLPKYVKCSKNVDIFKINLEKFKKCSMQELRGNYWDVSDTVLEKIEGPSYLKGKEKHNEYLRNNPWVARKRGINIS